MLGAEQVEHARERLAKVRHRHAGQLAARPGWITNRPQDIEDRAHADLAARDCGVAHGRVVQRREHEAEARLGHAARHTGRGEIDGDADGFQEIGRTARAGDAAIAVLGHAAAG